MASESGNPSARANPPEGSPTERPVHQEQTGRVIPMSLADAIKAGASQSTKHYRFDGSITLLLRNTLYRIMLSTLQSISIFWRDITTEGEVPSEENVWCIDAFLWKGEEFEAFLRVIDTPWAVLPLSKQTADEFVAVVLIADAWMCDVIMKKVAEELQFSTLLTPPRQISLAIQLNQADWIRFAVMRVIHTSMDEFTESPDINYLTMRVGLLFTTAFDCRKVFLQEIIENPPKVLRKAAKDRKIAVCAAHQECLDAEVKLSKQGWPSALRKELRTYFNGPLGRAIDPIRKRRNEVFHELAPGCAQEYLAGLEDYLTQCQRDIQDNIVTGIYKLYWPRLVSSNIVEQNEPAGGGDIIDLDDDGDSTMGSIS